MPTKIVIKNSSVIGKVPLLTDVDLGELALNFRDSTLYFNNGDEGVSAIGRNQSAEVRFGVSTTLNDSTSGTRFTAFNTTPHVESDDGFLDYANDGIIVSRSGLYLVLYTLVFATGGTNRRISGHITVNGTIRGGRSGNYSVNDTVSISGCTLLSLAALDKIGLTTIRLQNAGTMISINQMGGMIVCRVGV